jgi:two-component system, LytTR family, sensor kinase
MRAREMLRWWMWSIAIWVSFGIVNGTQVVVGMRAEGMHHPWFRLFAVYALSWVVWAAVSPLVLELGKRYPPEHNWAVHIAAYLVIGVMDGAWTVCLDLILKPMGESGRALNVVDAMMGFFYSKFHLDLIAYAGVLALGNTLQSRRTLAEREEQLAKARLEALRSQLQPHFLFNTLNGIAGLIRAGRNRTAIEMIAALSDLLRRVVEGPAGTETSLAEEVQFVEKYLGIQQMRFASRLRVAVDVPGELCSARVPSMILQPMVENAIEHGIGMKLEGGSIRIAARRVNGLLTMSVENDGPAITTIREGVGIANTRARLKNLYGETAALEIRNNPAGSVEALVTVPYQVMQ